MKTTGVSVAALQAEYERLRQSLAQVGCISQGSVQQRTVEDSGRSGYQWTRKVRGKTVTVCLSQAQYQAMKEAVANQRRLKKTLQQMEKIARQIIFRSAPDTRRRKRLSKKVLGVN